MKLNKFSLSLVFLVLGYGFLYLPITVLVAYSFNDSPLTQGWTGFSFRWYQDLFQNTVLLEAAWTSLKIATLTATVSVVLGTLAALGLVNYRKHWGHRTYSTLLSAPLVMPDVIMGIALLLLFVNLQQTFGLPQGRGFATVTIAHITVAMAYVTVVVKSRLLEFDHTLEEAALDLGAKPSTVFWRITLPVISPSLISGWLLAFTLSLDDVVLASFLSGPSSTTLPMVIFSSIRFGSTPEINALATIIVFIVSIGVIISGLVMFKRSKIGT